MRAPCGGGSAPPPPAAAPPPSSAAATPTLWAPCLVQTYVPPQVKTQLQTTLDKGKAWLNNATELELKVMEATNHEPWGPHGQAMNGARALAPAQMTVARTGALRRPAVGAGGASSHRHARRAGGPAPPQPPAGGAPPPPPPPTCIAEIASAAFDGEGFHQIMVGGGREPAWPRGRQPAAAPPRADATAPQNAPTNAHA
jgi:hypothetical protein